MQHTWPRNRAFNDLDCQPFKGGFADASLPLFWYEVPRVLGSPEVYFTLAAFFRHCAMLSLSSKRHLLGPTWFYLLTGTRTTVSVKRQEYHDAAIFDDLHTPHVPS